jgi:hypothetical protein
METVPAGLIRKIILSQHFCAEKAMLPQTRLSLQPIVFT